MSWKHSGQRKHSQTGHRGQGKGVRGSSAKPCQVSLNSSCRIKKHTKSTNVKLLCVQVRNPFYLMGFFLLHTYTCIYVCMYVYIYIYNKSYLKS